MNLDQSALLDPLGQIKLTDVYDRIRTATETLYQQLIDAETTAFIGAAPFEHSRARTTQRNGSFFPALLERRRCVHQDLYAVVMEAYLHEAPIRKVNDLVMALGANTGISKSEVSRICEDLDHEVGAFRDQVLSALNHP